MSINHVKIDTSATVGRRLVFLKMKKMMMTLIDSPVTVVDDYAPLAQCAVPKR